MNVTNATRIAVANNKIEEAKQLIRQAEKILAYAKQQGDSSNIWACDVSPPAACEIKPTATGYIKAEECISTKGAAAIDIDGLCDT